MKGTRRTRQEVESNVPSRMIDVQLAVVENTARWLVRDVTQWRFRKFKRMPTRSKAQWALKHIRQLQAALQELESVVCGEIIETPEVEYEIDEELELEHMRQESEQDSGSDC